MTDGKIASIMKVGGVAATAAAGILGIIGAIFQKKADKEAESEANARFLEQMDCRIGHAVDQKFEAHLNEGA